MHDHMQWLSDVVSSEIETNYLTARQQKIISDHLSLSSVSVCHNIEYALLMNVYLGALWPRLRSKWFVCGPKNRLPAAATGSREAAQRTEHGRLRAIYTPLITSNTRVFPHCVLLIVRLLTTILYKNKIETLTFLFLPSYMTVLSVS